MTELQRITANLAENETALATALAERPESERLAFEVGWRRSAMERAIKDLRRVDDVGRFTTDEVNAIHQMRSNLRDLLMGWPEKELGGDPREAIGVITTMLGDGYDFKRGE